MEKVCEVEISFGNIWAQLELTNEHCQIDLYVLPSYTWMHIVMHDELLFNNLHTQLNSNDLGNVIKILMIFLLCRLQVICC